MIYGRRYGKAGLLDLLTCHTLSVNISNRMNDFDHIYQHFQDLMEISCVFLI